jgi:hypothetical protein
MLGMPLPAVGEDTGLDDLFDDERGLLKAHKNGENKEQE